MSIINGAVLLKRKSEIRFKWGIYDKKYNKTTEAGLGDFHRLPDFFAYFLFFSEDFWSGSHLQEEYAYNLNAVQGDQAFYCVLARGIRSFLLNIVGNVVGFMPFGFFFRSSAAGAVTGITPCC